MRILWNNYLDSGSSWTAYSEDANYPVSNLYDTRLSRVYRSNDIDLVAFSSVGTAASNACEACALCALTSSLVAFFTNSSDSLHTYTWNGSSWATVGSALVISSASTPAMCAMTSSLVAYIDATNENLSAYEWNGSSWALSGSALAIAGIGVPSLCKLTTAQVALVDDQIDTIRTYTWNGSTWASVGTASTLLCSYPAICAMTSSLVTVTDETNHQLTAYAWNGSTWATVGTALTLSSADNPALCAITSTFIVYSETDSDELAAYRFDGSNYEKVGTEISVGTGSWRAMCAPTSSFIAFIESVGEDLMTYEIDADKNYLIVKETCAPQYLSILNHNISSDTEIYLEGASSSGFSTLTFSESITWSSYTIVSTITSTVSCDYFRLLLNLHSTTAGYVSMGYLYLGDYLQLPFMKPDQTIKDETTSKITISDGGQAYGDDGFSYVAPTINFPYITNTERASIRTMWASVKNYKPIILIIWESNTSVELPRYCILDQKGLEFKRTDDTNMPWSLSLQFREIF